MVSLFGVRSALFVAMNSKGRLYATVSSPGQGSARFTRLDAYAVEENSMKF